MIVSMVWLRKGILSTVSSSVPTEEKEQNGKKGTGIFMSNTDLCQVYVMLMKLRSHETINGMDHTAHLESSIKYNTLPSFDVVTPCYNNFK